MVILAAFGYSENPIFLSRLNMSNILWLATALGFVAVGRTVALKLAVCVTVVQHAGAGDRLIKGAGIGQPRLFKQIAAGGEEFHRAIDRDAVLLAVPAPGVPAPGVPDRRVKIQRVDRGRVGAGSTVLVSGAGPIGALTVLAARAAGAAVVIVAEPNPNRRRIISEIAPMPWWSIRPGRP